MNEKIEIIKIVPIKLNSEFSSSKPFLLIMFWVRKSITNRRAFAINIVKNRYISLSDINSIIFILNIAEIRFVETMLEIGVDISSYQANVDMEKLKEQNIRFVYIKATEGSTLQDDKFAVNWANAEKAGLPSGAYHFFSFDSPGSTQAENFIKTVGDDLKGRLLPTVDVEYYGDKKVNPPAKDDVVRELTVFLQALEAHYGTKPMIYTGSEIYEKYLQDFFGTYKMWISSFYTPLSWNYHGDWYIWQYLNRGTLEGYSGGEKYIDLNVLNKEKDLHDLMIQ